MQLVLRELLTTPDPSLATLTTPADAGTSTIDGLFASIRLDAVMARSTGSGDVVVAILDGPVDRSHPDLETARMHDVGAVPALGSGDGASIALRHGTFVAGVLSARRTAATPGICPGCTVLVRPIFADVAARDETLPGLSAAELAAALAEAMEAGARVVNVSGAIRRARIGEERELGDVLDDALRRDVVVVAAAGNERTVGGSAITTHPAVIPVVPYVRLGRPATPATLGRSIGRSGIGAPGDDVPGIAPGGGTTSMGGSSAAAPFVTGAAALLWSLVPAATAKELRAALVHPTPRRRRTVVPPLLDAAASHDVLTRIDQRRY